MLSESGGLVQLERKDRNRLRGQQIQCRGIVGLRVSLSYVGISCETNIGLVTRPASPNIRTTPCGTVVYNYSVVGAVVDLTELPWPVCGSALHEKSGNLGHHPPPPHPSFSTVNATGCIGGRQPSAAYRLSKHLSLRMFNNCHRVRRNKTQDNMAGLGSMQISTYVVPVIIRRVNNACCHSYPK